MAMAMAATAAGLGAVRVTIGTAASTHASLGGAAQLCSSFRGLSIGSWKKSGSGGEMSLSVAIRPAPVPISRPVVVAKLKTHKAAAKRFRVTGSGKIIRRQARRAHLLQKKTTKRKNRLSSMQQVNRRDYNNVIGALPYLKVKRIN